MIQDQPDYLSYLLRLWRTDNARGSTWRASLESPGNGECRAFASLEDLFTFLEAQTSHAKRSCENQAN